MLLACGAIEAITSATGSGPDASFAEWQMCTLRLWCAVSAIAMSAASEGSLQAVTASVQEADAWGQETGAPSVSSLSAATTLIYCMMHVVSSEVLQCSRRDESKTENLEILRKEKTHALCMSWDIQQVYACQPANLESCGKHESMRRESRFWV